LACASLKEVEVQLHCRSRKVKNINFLSSSGSRLKREYTYTRVHPGWSAGVNTSRISEDLSIVDEVNHATFFEKRGQLEGVLTVVGLCRFDDSDIFVSQCSAFLIERALELSGDSRSSSSSSDYQDL
jgi:hypothetical protein